MAAQIFPYGTALTVVWHLSKPDGTDFDITGYTYRVYYRTGNKETEANGSHVTASANTISIVIPATEPSAPGEYALRLVLYQNNKLFCTLNYNGAFVLSRRLAQDLAMETQQEEVQVVHLYTVAEFYLFTPIIPTVGSDGYWYVNGTKVTDGHGEFVPSSHTMEYDAQTNYIIIDRDRVDSQGHSIAQTITSLADALSTAAEDHETAQEDHSTAAGDHQTAAADHSTATWDHQAIVDMIDLYEPITINGDVTNAPDEEDITSDENELLKFKDRGVIYGMGYCILRRNKTFAEQVTKINTIYEIRYDFDLNGGSVTIPAGCTLKFVGGSLTNGSLTFQNTKLSGDIIDIDCEFSGTLANDIVYVNWFAEGDGQTNVTSRIKSCINSGTSKVVFSPGTYMVTTARSNGISLVSNIELEFAKGAVLKAINNNDTISSILYVDHVDNVIIRGGEFYGDLENNTSTDEGAGHGIHVSHCNNIRVEDVYIHHCFTDACYVRDVTNAVFSNCTFEHSGRIGHTITSGQDIVVENCISRYAERAAPMSCFGLEPNYDTDIIRNITYVNCLAEQRGTTIKECFYFNLHSLVTDNGEISISYLNCKSKGGYFFLGSSEPTEQQEGRILIDNYTSIASQGLTFGTGAHDAVFSPKIFINNPISLGGNTSGQGATYGSFFSTLYDTSSNPQGGIIINNASIYGDTLRRLNIAWTATKKNITVNSGDIDRLFYPDQVDYIGDFPNAVLDVSAGGTFSLFHRKIVANLTGSTIASVIRTDVPKNTECILEKSGTGLLNLAFNGCTFYKDGVAAEGYKLQTDKAYAFIKLRWVAENVAYILESSGPEDWSIVS